MGIDRFSCLSSTCSLFSLHSHIDSVILPSPPSYNVTINVLYRLYCACHSRDINKKSLTTFTMTSCVVTLVLSTA